MFPLRLSRRRAGAGAAVLLVAAALGAAVATRADRPGARVGIGVASPNATASRPSTPNTRSVGATPGPPPPARTPPVPSPASARFSAPTNGAAVESLYIMRGRAVVPRGKVLWVLIRPPNGVYYTTTDRPIPVNSSGDWSSTVKVGEGPQDPNGQAYELIAVITPAQGTIQKGIESRKPGQFSARFQRIPPDAQVVARVGITRR